MAENDATQPDAAEKEMGQGFKDESQEDQEEFQDDPSEEELSPREQAIEELVVKRNEEYDSEINETLSSEEVEETEEVEEAVEKKPSPVDVWEEDGTWYTAVKVDGQDIIVPFNDLKSSHQKDRASQKRFEEAAEYGRRVQEREAQLNAYVKKRSKVSASKFETVCKERARGSHSCDKGVGVRIGACSHFPEEGFL